MLKTNEYYEAGNQNITTPTNNGFNADLAAVYRFKIQLLKEIPSFNYITS